MFSLSVIAIISCASDNVHAVVVHLEYFCTEIARLALNELGSELEVMQLWCLD